MVGKSRIEPKLPVVGFPKSIGDWTKPIPKFSNFSKEVWTAKKPRFSPSAGGSTLTRGGGVELPNSQQM